MDKVVYTSIDDFKLKKWEVRSYKELNESFAEWIEETTLKLIQKRSLSELKALDDLKSLFPIVYEQPYFMLRGRSYFLDFYLPAYKIAIEIDGDYHKERKLEDKRRDSDFREIGIRTMRIRAKDVYSNNFKTVLVSKLKAEKSKKPKKAKSSKGNNKSEKESHIIRSAWKRLREHDSNKHKAKWV